LAYAEALLGNRQFTGSCAEFAKLKDAPLGPRDRGVPAARACMQSGDADAAIAWIASIPARFRPRELEADPIFAALRSRADFRALFEQGNGLRGGGRTRTGTDHRRYVPVSVRAASTREARRAGM
jgi:hypothetical protein